MTDLPPAGWYDDPTSPVQERWWDGERWSEQTRRKATQDYEPRPGELRPVGDYLGHAFSLMRARWDEYLLVCVVGGVLLAIASLLLVRPIIDALTFTDREIIGFGGAQLRLLGGYVVVAIVVAAAMTMALYRITWAAAQDEPSTWSEALQYGVAGTPRLIGWGIFAAAPLLVLFAVAIGVARAGAGVAVLLFFVAIVAAAWWAVVVSFLPVALVAQPSGTNPLVVGFATVRGRWWRVFGRVLLMGLIAGLIVQVVSAILGQFVGAAVFGIEIVDAGNGQLDIQKDLGTPLQFFLGSLVFVFMSLVGNVATYAGVTSMAVDVMPRADGGDADPFGAATALD